MKSPLRLSPDDTREFVHRDRSELARLKREHWAAEYKLHGPASILRIAHALYQHARRVNPKFPDPRMRTEDLRDHIALKAKIDRASRGFTLR